MCETNLVPGPDSVYLQYNEVARVISYFSNWYFKMWGNVSRRV